jgi:hypothetical protein
MDAFGVDGADWRIEVDNNSISNNETKSIGGGIDVELYATEVAASSKLLITVDGNEINGNRTTSIPSGPSDFRRGGGIAALWWSWQTPASPDIGVSVENNRIRLNLTAGFGGGAALYPQADDDWKLTGSPEDASATLRFKNNLVAENAAANADASAAGGGVYVFAESWGDQATARADLDFLTVASNDTDLGAGGIELEWLNGANGGGPGETAIDVTNSIVSGNESFGVGALVTPSGTASVSIRYDDAFGNQGGNYESSLTAGEGCLSVDPALSATFVPSACSPTINAADPLEPVGAEPQPNGKRANMGHLGTTAGAIQTFPDTDGSKKIDGVDVLNVAFAFASTPAQPGRFNPNADRDLDNDVDGSDLSYVTAFFGQSCP